MKAGDTFLLSDPQVDSHLWIVLSDPAIDSDHVLIVSLTTAHPLKEQACIIEAAEHPWVRHETCVHYQESKVVSLDKLHKLKDNGLLNFKEPLSERLLTRIRAGAEVSNRIKLDHKQILIDQDFIQG